MSAEYVSTSGGLNTLLNEGIEQIAASAARYYIKSGPGRRFMSQLLPRLRRSAQIRKGYGNTGRHIPPFLIASIASQCNLNCAGCYSRASNTCSSSVAIQELGIGDWERIFSEAEQLGVSFVLIAGGEPLLRRDILTSAAQHRDMVFPVFTNGLAIDEDYLELFCKNRHLIPVLSIEGGAEETDRRRGSGVSQRILEKIDTLHQRKILYGVSITVTRENLSLVSSDTFLSQLKERGCGLVFFVEYVPAQEGTEHLILSEKDNEFLAQKLSHLKQEYRDMVLISFPGDEKLMGGCLAAGRGFFHINPTGGAEPCPFAPYSDRNLKNCSLLEALDSPLFLELQRSGILTEEHTGGCTLFGRKSVMQSIVNL